MKSLRYSSLRGGRSRFMSVFAADANGNVAILTALSLTIICAMVGGALDFGRAYQARSQAQAALDAAVLAAGRVLQTTQSKALALDAANSYFNQTKPSSLQGVSVSFNIEANNTLVKGTAAGAVPTLLLGVMHMETMDIKVQSRSELAGGGNSGTNYEISLMLDVTGSMCPDGTGPCTSGAKLDGLKAAAKDLVNIVVWQDQSSYTSRVAIVPFSTRVRVGTDGNGGGLMKVLTNLDATRSAWYELCTNGSGGGGSESDITWTCYASASTKVNNWKVMPCVSDRTGPAALTDDPPGPDKWLNAHEGTRMPLSWDSSDTPPTQYTGATQADPSYDWNYEPGGWCADLDNSNVMMPLTSDKSQLQAKIDGLSAFGATAGALGTAWSWYTLSPKWDQVWTGNSKPGDYADLTTLKDGRPVLKKVAVLMTDGQYNTDRTWKGADPATVSSNAKTICQNMKSAGIEIYTVGFGLNELPAADRARAEDTLLSCGTDVQHFYNAFNVDQLKGAFRDIALKLAVLRITK